MSLISQLFPFKGSKYYLNFLRRRILQNISKVQWARIEVGFQIGILLHGIARNGCFRLWHCFSILKSIILSVTYKFMQQIQAWKMKYLCRF